MATTENNFPNNRETKKTFSESSAILEAQDKLDSCEHYFIFWLGESKLDKNSLETLAEDTESIETYEPEKHNEAAEKGQTVDTLNTKEKIDEGSEKKPESDEKTKSNDKAIDNSEEKVDKDSLRDPIHDNMDLQRSASLIAQCFLNVHFEDIDLAKQALARCTNFIKNISLQEFVSGFFFLIHLLEIHLKLKENSHDMIEEVFSPSFGTIDHLHDKGKAMIYLAKWTLLELTDTRRQDSLDAMRNVIEIVIFICFY